MPEQTYLKFHPTKLAYIFWYLMALIIIIIGIFVILSVYGIIPFKLPISKDYGLYTILIPFIGVAFIIIASILRNDDTYYITNYRVIEKKGILNIKEDSVNWEKVSNYSLSQSVIERLFNIGTLRLYSIGGAEDVEAEIVIKKAANIHKIKAFLDKLIERKGPVV
jgi:uncharacterized membrane protein YdbT with pleckstrin-like domain